jgi:hypothetical protein
MRAGQRHQSRYFEMARIILAEIWRKNMDAMKESERTRTMKGSLVALMISAVVRRGERGRERK